MLTGKEQRAPRAKVYKDIEIDKKQKINPGVFKEAGKMQDTYQNRKLEVDRNLIGTVESEKSRRNFPKHCYLCWNFVLYF